MNNHPELCLLSQQYNPVAMCLQETHIADVSKISFKGYTSYHKVDNSHDRASGGSSVLIRNSIIHSPVNLNTNLQAVAVKITLSFVFTICSIYAPPNKCIGIKDLEHLLSQIQEPVMILYSVGPHPVSSLYIYTFVVSRAFMAGAASQAGDADSSRAPGLTSGLQGSVNVHRGTLLLVPQ